MSNQKINDVRYSRRHFLYGALMTGLGIAAVATMPKGVAEAVPETGQASTGSSSTSQGYHLTQHISDYYKSAR